MFDTRIFRSLGLLLAALAIVIAIGLRTAPSSAGSAPPLRYAVAPGDTLWAIADAHSDGDPRAMVGEIRQLNGLDDPLIMTGQILLLPAT